jgi:hypothetical protein
VVGSVEELTLDRFFAFVGAVEFTVAGGSSEVTSSPSRL